MRTLAARPALISGAALAGALAWGAVEFFALQWSRLADRIRRLGGAGT